MVSYLQAQNLTRSVGDKTLFHDLSFSIGEGQKVGLIAKNGTGKSTLLNILSGKDQADEGQVVFHNDIRIGYLEQTPVYPPDLTVIEACFGTATRRPTSSASTRAAWHRRIRRACRTS